MKPSQHETEKRERLGDKYVSGIGFEIGAGQAPSQYADVEHTTYIDKRSREWMERKFGEPLPYHVVSWGEALQMERGDFIVAHHVIEHQRDPIGEFMRWLKLLKVGGRFFISLPAPTNVCERERLLTPIEHILDDHVFERDFDDRQHVFSAQCQRFAADGARSRYSRYSGWGFAHKLLHEMKLEDLDCHFHTYSLEVMGQVIVAACYFSGMGLLWLHAEDNGSGLYFIGEIRENQGRVPDFIIEYKKRLREAQERIKV